MTGVDDAGTDAPRRPRVRRSTVVVVLLLVLVGLVVADLVSRRTSTPPAGAATSSATVRCTDDDGDAATLQRAIDDSAEGGEVIFAGPCRITATVVLKGGRSYRGESRSTTLTQAPGANLAAVLASDTWDTGTDHTGEPISLRDLTVDGNKAENPKGDGDGVVIRSWQTQVVNVQIRNTRGDGLTIGATAKDGAGLKAGKTQVVGTIRDVLVLDAGRNGIYVQDDGNSVTDWYLLDSVVGGSGQSGIRMENAAGWRVSGNHLYDDGAAGIWADRMFSTSIDHNQVEDFGAGHSAIQVSVQDGAPSVIDGNRLFQAQEDGGDTFLAVRGVASGGTGTLAVTGNAIRGNGTGTGLSYEQGSGTLAVTSTGNAVTGVTTPVTGVAPAAAY